MSAGALLAALLLAATPRPSTRPVMSQIAVLDDPRAPLEKRVAAARALGESRDARALEPLVRALELTNEDLRDAAREALRKLGGAATFAATLADASRPVPERESAANALRHLQDPSTVQPLAAALAAPEAEVRRAAAHALAVFGAARAESALTIALEDPDADVRYFAAIALRGVNSEAARAALRKRAAVETDEGVRLELEKAAK